MKSKTDDTIRKNIHFKYSLIKIYNNFKTILVKLYILCEIYEEVRNDCAYMKFHIFVTLIRIRDVSLTNI